MHDEDVTPGAAERELTARAAARLRPSQALRHLHEIDYDGLEVHALLGVLAVRCPADVIAAVHQVIAERIPAGGA